MWLMLQRLDAFFFEQDAPIAKALRSGAQEVRDWYAWHNGVDEDVPGMIRLPNLMLLSSGREALKNRQWF